MIVYFYTHSIVTRLHNTCTTYYYYYYYFYKSLNNGIGYWKNTIQFGSYDYRIRIDAPSVHL